jgi:hypothetical protein
MDKLFYELLKLDIDDLSGVVFYLVRDLFIFLLELSISFFFKDE